MSSRFLSKCLAAVALLGVGSLAQPAAAADISCPQAEAKIVQRVYAVADLIIPLDQAQQTLEEQLTKLIASTIAPESWDNVGGPATMAYYPLGMALVINQTPDVHEQIAELLAALRRLQDVEVVVEMRFVKVSEAFLERIGCDFDTRLKNAPQDDPEKSAASKEDSAASSSSEPGPMEAHLSDSQLFLFLEAVQGDPRAYVLQAPKLTLFNGQTATMKVASAEGETPSGFQMSVQPVVSADRRFVHLSLKATIAEQPKSVTWAVQSTVKVPDGGTVLLGGLKTVRESRSEFSPPVLSKIPHINRMFKNVSYGRESERVMLLVTSRIVVNAEIEAPEAARTCPARTPKAADKPAASADPQVVPASAVTPIPIMPWIGERLQQKCEDQNNPRTPTVPPIRDEAASSCEAQPDQAQVLRALPRVQSGIPCIYEEYRDDIQVVYEKLVDRVDPPRCYPLIGPAQLHRCHWKCTVYCTEVMESGYPIPFRVKRPRIDVVYLDQNYLHLCAAQSEPVPSQLPPSTADSVRSRSEAKVAKLAQKYHQACAEGRLGKARKLAEQALRLDPACFSKERDSRATPRILELLNNSKDLHQIEYEWERIWFTEQPSHLTPERVHGGIQ
jgi:hypothetical protein